MVSGDHEGWGETTPFAAPTYSPETATTVFFLNQEVFCPLLVGREWDTAEDLLSALRFFKGNPFAKAGPESAWWDLKARMEGRPVGSLLKDEGGRMQDEGDLH